MTEVVAMINYEVKQAEYDPSLDELDPHARCEYCSGQVTRGEAMAYGICSDCYWSAAETEVTHA